MTENESEGDSPMAEPAICQMLNQTIVEATKSAISEVMPELSDRMKNSFLEPTNKAVDESIKQIKTEVEKAVIEKTEGAERRCEIETMFEAELLESCNTRNIIRYVGVKEDPKH